MQLAAGISRQAWLAGRKQTAHNFCQSRSVHPAGRVRLSVAAPSAPFAVEDSPVQHTSLPADIKKVLFSAEDIRGKVQELAAEICRDYRGKQLAVIGVLNGAFIFTSGRSMGSIQRSW